MSPNDSSGLPVLGRFPRRKLSLPFPASFHRKKAGGDERVRTDDPLLAKQVLSQLSYTPTVIPAFVLFALLKVLAHPQNYTVQSAQNTNLSLR